MTKDVFFCIMCFIFSIIREHVCRYKRGDRCVEGLYWISDNHERKRERAREKERRTGKFPMGLFDASVCLLHCLGRYVGVFAFDISQTYLSLRMFVSELFLFFSFSRHRLPPMTNMRVAYYMQNLSICLSSFFFFFFSFFAFSYLINKRAPFCPVFFSLRLSLSF